MKKLLAFAVLIGLALSASASTISYSYRITGARETSPLQVFDDGAKLYLQLSPARLMAPPVPFAEDGRPVEYEIRPPYMVLPLMDRLVLRVGGTKTLIENMPEGRSKKSANGVAGVNVWYGAAPAAAVTSSATAPVSAVEVAGKVAHEKTVADLTKQAAQETPKPAPSTPKANAPEGMGGKFTVFGRAAPETREWLLFSVSKPIVSAEIAQMDLLPTLVVEADGSAAGVRKAMSLKSLMPGKVIEVKARGAESGYIRVSKGS